MKHKKSKQRIKYPKPRQCEGKTLYPNEDAARRAMTLTWGVDPRADLKDLHVYECDHGSKGFHVGHRSYFEMKVRN